MLARLFQFIDRLRYSTLLKLPIGIAIVGVGALMVNGFPSYFPPDFTEGFLRGRASYFVSSGYAIGFYAHIVAAPIVLLTGVLQMSKTLRTRKPRLHKRLGDAYVWLTLIAAAPGGLVMSTRSAGGFTSGIAFALISVLCWLFTWRAWRFAKAKRFKPHRDWMMRSFLMIVSAVLLRLVYIVVSTWELDRIVTYQISVWLSWLPPYLALECWLLVGRRVGKTSHGPAA